MSSRKGWHFFIFMTKEKICSFFGHRTVDAKENIIELIKTEIYKAIEFGCTTFFFGGYGEFDDLCYQVLTEVIRERPEFNLKRKYCVSQERFLCKKTPYFNREDYDDVVYLVPSFDGWYKSIYFRNCAMIDNSDYVVFYAEEKKDSGAYKALKYAKKQKDKIIVNIYN